MTARDRRYGSPRWRKLTRAIQVRDLWQCQYCGGPSSLTDHVIRADEAPWLFWDESNLKACCRSCNQGRRQNGDAWLPTNRWGMPRQPLVSRGLTVTTDYSRRPKPRIG
jgi:5-methylcytosine-specific restriction endonuclease McrA